MNDSERWTTAFALALAAHFLVLRAGWIKAEIPGRPGPSVVVEISRGGSRSEDAPGADIRFERNAGDEEVDAAAQRRRIYRRYLDDIGEAVHVRRFEYGRRDLIGVAVYGFVVEPDGSFSRIELRSSSGNADLDSAAGRSVRAASGIVKRPAELGNEPIAVILPIKYQYGLR
ncbi:MAG: TonB family protein [Candidatus Accumulibacter sp.]|jgi:TonB family protein|nr:TonB family protein [Accumulibacter sp.]